MLVALEQTTYVGPAYVLQAVDKRIQIELPDQQVWALIALAYPYQPSAGDIVLAIGQEDNWYVIGVLNGSGNTTLTVPADLHLQAPHGSIELSSAKGIRIRSSAVKIVSNKLELIAQRSFERYANATRWVKEAFQLRAGRVRTSVDSSYRVTAERIVERAEDDVRIDGRKIHLG